MIDHVSVAVRDLMASAGFYEKVLAPLGLTRLVDREGTVGFGKRYPEFWLNARPEMESVPDDTGIHLCLRAPDRNAVEQFHRLAVELDGRSDGAPAEREATVTTYFGTFIRDPDGNKIEAITFPPKENA